MAKGKATAQQLKHDPLMDKYLQSSEWVQNRRQPLLMGLLAAAALLVLFFGIRWFLSSQDRKAGEALAQGFCWDQAIVADPLPPAKAGQCAAKTDDEKHRKAFEAFEKATASNGDLARYYGATHQLYFEAQKAEATLKSLADGGSAMSDQARLALAERYRTSNRLNEALAEYKKLKEKPGNLSPLLIDLNLGKVYEAQGQKKEAGDLYFNVAKEGGKATVATDALQLLTLLDPDRVDQLPQEERRTGGRSGNLALPK